MRSIDQFLGRMPKQGYNCLDFVREVWLDVQGEDITAKLTKLQGAFDQRHATASGLKGFKKLERPVTPCFVVMQRKKLVPHIGIHIDGRILHLTDNGVQFQPLIVSKGHFRNVKYYQ